MEAILELARQLGRAITQSDRARALKDARKTASADADATRLMQGYKAHADLIANKEKHRQPIEVADKRKLAELEQQMAANPGLKQLMRAQADYIDLMRQVNGAIASALAEVEGAEQPPPRSS